MVSRAGEVGGPPRPTTPPPAVLTRLSPTLTLLTVALALFALGMAGCAAPAPLLDASDTDGHIYRLEEAGWVRYHAERPVGLVDPAVLVVRRTDGAPVVLRDLRALGVTGLDHLRSIGSTAHEAEVHFVDAESGFAAYKLLLTASVRGDWASVSLREVEEEAASVLLSSNADRARKSGHP